MVLVKSTSELPPSEELPAMPALEGMTKEKAAALAIHSLFGTKGSKAWDEIRDIVGPEITDALVAALGRRWKMEEEERGQEIVVKAQEPFAMKVADVQPREENDV